MEALGFADEVGKRPRFHFPHEASAVQLDRNLANSKLACDLLVHQPRDTP
jgi:hypothetical protein